MNPEFKTRWIAALRSGEYEQGAGWLRSGDRFCCLGVACDLIAKDGGGEWKKAEFLLKRRGFRERFRAATDFSHSGKLPRALARRLGIGIDPHVGSMNEFLPDYSFYDRATLATLNDKGVDFRKIADIIEERL